MFISTYRFVSGGHLKGQQEKKTHRYKFLLIDSHRSLLIVVSSSHTSTSLQNIHTHTGGIKLQRRVFSEDGHSVKMSIFGVILALIFPHSDLIRTRITLNTDTFHALGPLILVIIKPMLDMVRHGEYNFHVCHWCQLAGLYSSYQPFGIYLIYILYWKKETNCKIIS